jgi:hypothetical protein
MQLLGARRLALVLVSVVMAAACGGGEQGGGAVASGVPQGTVLGGMSSDNLQKVCESVDRWGKQGGMEDKLKEFGCRMRGNVVAALIEPASRQSTCQALYDPCAQAPAPTAASGANCTPPPASCSATVGELETCLNQMPQVIDELLVILPTCDQVATVAGNPIATALTKIPSSCQALNAKCAGWDKLPGSAPAPR